MKKTVLELDLIGYSTICANLEEGLDVQSLPQLNAQIQGFVDAGLAAVNASRERVVIQTTGDGAILVFDSAADAYIFAVTVHEVTDAHNAKRTQALAKRVFRIGAATGDIVMDPKPSGGFEIAGGTIARAVRLEAKAPPGGLLVDETTFSDLRAAERKAFGTVQSIFGKRDEVFDAYLTQPNPNGPRDAEYFVALGRKAPPSPVLKVWQEKLVFLQEQEATTADAAQKFAIKRQIEEVKAKIREHGGES